jgi:large subunit ribosomal protein L20
MPRSVNAVAARQRRKRILDAAKGYFGARKNVYSVAKNAVDKALGYAYRDRRNKKRAFRRLWIARINAGARLNGTTYSKLIHALQDSNIQLNRKVLADLAVNDSTAFAAVVRQVSK